MYDEPTVIIAQRVTGEEEVPEGAVAVLTPDAPDVLSHVSVRARNMRVLFAICHDPGELAKVIAVPESRHLGGNFSDFAALLLRRGHLQRCFTA